MVRFSSLAPAVLSSSSRPPICPFFLARLARRRIKEFDQNAQAWYFVGQSDLCHLCCSEDQSRRLREMYVRSSSPPLPPFPLHRHSVRQPHARLERSSLKPVPLILDFLRSSVFQLRLHPELFRRRRGVGLLRIHSSPRSLDLIRSQRLPAAATRSRSWTARRVFHRRKSNRNDDPGSRLRQGQSSSPPRLPLSSLLTQVSLGHRS